MLEPYGWMGVVSGLAQAVYLTTAFVLSGHLLLRAHRTGDFAPRLLGIQLLFAMGFGYLLCAAGTTLSMLSRDASPRTLALLLGTGNAATMAGLCAAFVFDVRVFWAGRRWPWAVGALLLAWMGAGWLGSAASGGFTRVSYANGWFLALNAGMLATNLWVAVEPLVHHARLRKGVRFGLAEPVVVDRFLLWGLGSLARAALILIGPLGEWALGGMSAGGRSVFVPLTLAAASALGLLTSVSYWLTFNPSPAYQRWVGRRYRHPG